MWKPHVSVTGLFLQTPHLLPSLIFLSFTDAHLQCGHMKVLMAQCLWCITSLSDGMTLPHVGQRSWPAGTDGPPSASSDDDNNDDKESGLVEVGVVFGKWGASLNFWPPGDFPTPNNRSKWTKWSTLGYEMIVITLTRSIHNTHRVMKCKPCIDYLHSIEQSPNTIRCTYLQI